jgi:hypothetical protein
MAEFFPNRFTPHWELHMNAVLSNHRPPRRRSLSDEVDRLDRILDGLAEAIDETIADAAREGARLASREAIHEVLANAELQATWLAGGRNLPPDSVDRPRLTSAGGTDLTDRVRVVGPAVARVVRSAVAQCVSSAASLAKSLEEIVAAAWRVVGAILPTVIAGLAGGLGAYSVATYAGAVPSALAGACVAMAVRAQCATRSVLPDVSPVSLDTGAKKTDVVPSATVGTDQGREPHP